MNTVQRSYDGQRIAKMLKAAKRYETNGNRNKTNNGKVWEELIYKLDYNNFPALGQEKHKSTGKYVKIRFENPNLNINDAHPVQVGQVLKQYFLGHTEQRKSKNCITLKTKDRKQCEALKKLKEDILVSINGQQKKVVFEEIVSRNQCKGVVFEASWKQMTEDEIKNELIAEGYPIKDVRQMKKRMSDKTEVKTNCCVLTFDTDELPDRVTMCGVSYKIREYFPNPLICGKCQKIGHIRAKCGAEVEVCRKCGNTQEDEHMCPPPKCPNCPSDDNNHAPNGPDCPKYEFEKMVIQHKVKNKLSYAKARNECTELLMNENNKWTENTSTRVLQEQPETTPNTQLNNESLKAQLASDTQVLEEARQYRMQLEKVNREYQEELKRITELKTSNESFKRKIQEESELQRNNESFSDLNKKPRMNPCETSVAPIGAKPLADNEFHEFYNTKLSQVDKQTVMSFINEHKLKNQVIKWYLSDGILTPVLSNQPI